MPAGLRVWDAAGNLIVDLSTSMGRVLGVQFVNTATGSFDHAGLSQGTPFALVGGEAPATGGDPWAWAPSVDVTGTTLSWDFGDRPAGPAWIIFGVY